MYEEAIILAKFYFILAFTDLAEISYDSIKFL